MREGISVIQCGPSLETRAELRMMRALGGDVVGLSCVSFTVTTALFSLSFARSRGCLAEMF